MDIQYDTYMRSQRWAALRRTALRRTDYKCAICGTKGGDENKLEVHHLTYERLGCEEIDDVITLCKSCHNEVHEYVDYALLKLNKDLENWEKEERDERKSGNCSENSELWRFLTHVRNAPLGLLAVAYATYCKVQIKWGDATQWSISNFSNFCVVYDKLMAIQCNIETRLQTVRATKSKTARGETKGMYANNKRRVTTHDNDIPLWERDTDFLNPYKELPPLQTWCKIGDRQALPKEGIITFSAKQKKGKSLSTYALAIPLLSGNTFDTLTPIDRPNLVMVFDMEMSETTLTNRVLRQIQTIGENGSRFVVCSIKAKSFKERIDIISAKVDLYNPDIVVIDQAAKLVQNVNDTTEASEVTDFLDKLSVGRAVWVVMHENKSANDSNMRGHLGSYLSFAAVEAYGIDRKDKVFTITPKEARDTDTEDAACVRFTLDDNGTIINATKVLPKQQGREEQEYKTGYWHDKFRTLFSADHRLSYGELKKRIMEQGMSPATAGKWIAAAHKDGVVRKISNDRCSPYELVSEVV